MAPSANARRAGVIKTFAVGLNTGLLARSDGGKPTDRGVGDEAKSDGNHNQSVLKQSETFSGSLI